MIASNRMNNQPQNKKTPEASAKNEAN